MRIAAMLLLSLALNSSAQQTPRASAPRSFQPSTDSLSRQGLTFDSTFADLTLRYLHTKDSALLQQLDSSPATSHLLEHARNFDYEVPKDSAPALTAHLLSKATPDRIAVCEKSLAYFRGPMLADTQWLNESLQYLSPDFHFHGSLFLIFGYDIGVAYGANASLNCGHPHFAAHLEELKFYAIHELHHVGFMSYQPPPRLEAIKTCRDVLKLVEYSTQLEGMAVLAAYRLRQQQHALDDDEDYVALQSAARMQHLEELYFQDLHYLQQRGDEPADDAAWAVITRMSSGERLWYRVGARMAQAIEQKSGRQALVALIPQGPERFLEFYESLATPRAATLPQPASPQRPPE